MDTKKDLLKKIAYCLPFIIFSNFIISCEKQNDKKIVLITASYNNIHWAEQNLLSIFSQTYSNYFLIYIDDNSTDGTYELVNDIIRKNNKENQVSLIRNTQKMGALFNHYNAIHSCADDDIIIILDGDDWLAHNEVLNYINNIYITEDIWLTYGQFQEYPSNLKGFCKPMPEYIIQENGFREYSHTPSHLRTFYAWLYKNINKNDLIVPDTNEFFNMCADIATMFPMIEMSRDGHFKFIDEILLIYNTSNPLNDHKVSKQLQRLTDLYIRNLPKYLKATDKSSNLTSSRKYMHCNSSILIDNPIKHIIQKVITKICYNNMTHYQINDNT